MIDRHLHDVVAGEPSESAESTPEDVPKASAWSPAAAEEHSKARLHAAAPQAESSPPQANSAPQTAHDGRTWVTKWRAGQHSQAPLTGLRQGSTGTSGPTPDEKSTSPGGAEAVAGLQEGTVYRQGSNGATVHSHEASQAATHGAGSHPDSGSRDVSSWDFVAADSRAAICMHPGAHRAAQVSGGAAEHATPPAAAGSTSALESAHTAESVAVLTEAPAEPQPNPVPPSRCRQGRRAADANGSDAPVPSSSSAPPQEPATPSSCASALPAGRSGSEEAAVADTRDSGRSAESGPGVLAAACMPFEDPAARAWYCCDLFGADGGSAPGLPFASMPAGSIQTFGTADEATVAQKALQGAPLSPALRPPATCLCQSRCLCAVHDSVAAPRAPPSAALLMEAPHVKPL